MFNELTIKAVKDKLGELIKALRKREGLTQQELAEKLNLSRLTIQHLESGKNPTIDTLFIVLKHFDQLESFHQYIDSEIQKNTIESLY